jgi:uncharacterized protein YjbI with pentapeptide repeats
MARLRQSARGLRGAPILPRPLARSILLGGLILCVQIAGMHGRPASASVNHQAVTQSSADEKDRLEIEKLRLENEKLQQEIDSLQGGQSAWRIIPQYAVVATALVALLGFLYTAWAGIRQREAENLRRFDERFDLAVTNLASSKPVLQVSAAASILSFSKPQYGRFHEQVLMVALNSLKIDHKPEVQRLLLRGFELASRQLLSNRSRPREQHPGNQGLSVLDLTHAHLDRVDLSGLEFAEADIAHAELNHAVLRGTNLYRAQGYGVHLSRATLTDASLGEARLRKAQAQGAHFHRTRLMSSRLEEADLRSAQFQGAHLQSAHLNEADLRGANFHGSDVTDTYFVDAVFDDAALTTLMHAQHLDQAHLDAAALQRLTRIRSSPGLADRPAEDTTGEGPDLP